MGLKWLSSLSLSGAQPGGVIREQISNVHAGHWQDILRLKQLSMTPPARPARRDAGGGFWLLLLVCELQHFAVRGRELELRSAAPRFVRVLQQPDDVHRLSRLGVGAPNPLSRRLCLLGPGPV